MRALPALRSARAGAFAPIRGIVAILAFVLATAAPAVSAADALLIRNVRLYDGERPVLQEGVDVLLEDRRVALIGRALVPPDGAVVLDGAGRVAIPGLIDAHFHPAVVAGFATLKDMDPSYAALLAAAEMRRTLLRGFTTVRDMGGPSFGLKQAIDEGVIEGPRIYPSGAILSQTSGHGDFRPKTAPPRRLAAPDPLEARGFAAIVDGPDAVLEAVRDQLRAGATQIKLAAGGGISSDVDPIDSVQFTAGELRAAVAAASDWGTYVAVHAYTPESIRRALEAGVRSIEHGHLIDEPTMKLLAERGAFLSPQVFAFTEEAIPLYWPPGVPPRPGSAAQQAKAQQVRVGLDTMMQLAKRYRVKVAFGTDLFGGARVSAAENREFGARLKWFSSPEILHQATGLNGDLLAMSGKRNPYSPVGRLVPGAAADLLIVDGDPLADVTVLERPEQTLRLIVKDGRVVKNTLTPP